jgi:S-adenosylmethionine:tRNA ribosyltransferase-isomerase
MTKKKNSLTLEQFNYHLPQELISQQPIKPRDSARLLILDRNSEKLAHRHFYDLPEILEPGDVLVFNDSKVIPARLLGTKETGGKAEIFLLKKLRNKEGKKLRNKEIKELGNKGIRKLRGDNAANTWEVMIGGKVVEGQKVFLDKTAEAVIKKRIENNIWQVTFNCSDKKLFSLGQTPLPPYIKEKARLEDYQTIFAKSSGSVAAPTAGLHFTKRLLEKLKKQGIQLEYLTLHVGLGTFAPVKEENILQHQMHSELAMIDAVTARRLNQAKREGRRIIAVGTTSVRTLESFADKRGFIKPGSIDTDIFIYPGYKFKFINQIITNFHLPKSTLLMLVAAFAGNKLIFKAYREAIKKKYSFFSFGDGMLIR